MNYIPLFRYSFSFSYFKNSLFPLYHDHVLYKLLTQFIKVQSRRRVMTFESLKSTQFFTYYFCVYYPKAVNTHARVLACVRDTYL